MARVVTGTDSARHYDRVTEAWQYLLGPEMHYGLFVSGTEPLAVATNLLTRRMAQACCIDTSLDILDVGCGTGTQACWLAAEHGARVTGITNSAVGVAAAVKRAETTSAGIGAAGAVQFLRRSGTSNGFDDQSFDRAWVLESSHLMPDRAKLVDECARVLRPGGWLALCDVMLRRAMPFRVVRELRRPLSLLRDVFGDARMERLDTYAILARNAGMVVEVAENLTMATRPTFDRWRNNAVAHEDTVARLIGAADLALFVEACNVLESFWDDGTLGYGLVAARKPASVSFMR